MHRTIHTDVAILGGGISGLWILNVLRKRGYRALLLEKRALGDGQTIASQGMIHGGIKYTLEGFTTGSSETIAAMPDLWRDCLSGNGPVDLSGVSLLSPEYFLFSDDSVTSRLTAFFGSRSLRGRISPLDAGDCPEPFDHPSFGGNVYRLRDIVLDSASLLAALFDDVSDYVFKATASLVDDESGGHLELEDGTHIIAGNYVLAAGAGNEALLGDSHPSCAMQRRPLHQVMVKSPDLPRLYAHAVNLGSGAKPRVTITTHSCNGENVWYLGGNVAETGVHRGEVQQIEFARSELNALFPWIDLENAGWATLRIDRAEPAQKTGTRPDQPFARALGKAIVCWPTKLTLVPMLADQVLGLLDRPSGDSDEPLPDLAVPAVARPPWERLF